MFSPVEPVVLSVALANFEESANAWLTLIHGERTGIATTADGRRCVRLATRGVAYLNLVEADDSFHAGDAELVLASPDLRAQRRALETAGIPFHGDERNGLRVAPGDANGVAVHITSGAPRRAEMPILDVLPYVIDLAVADLESAVRTWDALLGPDQGVRTPSEMDASGALDMHHYTVGGETHAIGLMARRPQARKEDETVASLEYILNTHGDGVACVGFLFPFGMLCEHITDLPEWARRLLVREELRDYAVGRNTVTYPSRTGGVQVVLAEHIRGWHGDLHQKDEPSNHIQEG